MIVLSKRTKYTPKCKGNRDLPAGEQVAFDIRGLSGEEEERFSMNVSSINDGETQKLLIEPKAVPMFVNQVEHVYGVVDEKGKPVTDPAEFVKMFDTYEYITETVAYIRQGLPEEDLKN